MLQVCKVINRHIHRHEKEEEVMRGVLHAKIVENWKQIELLKMGFELQMCVSSREG